MLGNIFFWLTKGKRVEQLVRQVAMQVGDLSGSPTAGSGISRQDLIRVLQSTSLLLEGLKKQQKTTTTNSTQAAISEVISVKQPIQVPSEQPAIPVASPEKNHQELSATAKDLMKLSDWVLLAKVGKTSVQPEVLEEVYGQITVALAKEGVTLLNLDGLFDYERQMVVGTQPTDDPALNDHICNTIRPGFLFNEQLIRPQEVIVYISQ